MWSQLVRKRQILPGPYYWGYLASLSGKPRLLRSQIFLWRIDVFPTNFSAEFFQWSFTTNFFDLQYSFYVLTIVSFLVFFKNGHYFVTFFILLEGMYSRVTFILEILEILKGPSRFRIFWKMTIWKTGFRFPLSQKAKICRPF